MFEVLIGTKKAASVKISMDKVELLWEALGGDFDRSKGKGSHSKATLGQGEEEKMLIFSNKTYLIEYQIKDIAKALIDLELYPEDFTEELKRKQLLQTF